MKGNAKIVSIARFYALIVICTAIKFFCVDFAVADVLNWPVLTLSDESLHVLRHFIMACIVLLPSAAALSVALAPALFVPRAYRVRALLVLDFLITVLVVTDRLYIRYYTDIFIFKDLMLLPQTGLIAKSIWSLLKATDFLLFADIPIIAYLIKRGRLAVEPCILCASAKKRICALVIISVIIQAGAFINLKIMRPTIIKAMYDRMSVCAWLSTATFHWCDFSALTVKFLSPEYTNTEMAEETQKWFEANYEPSVRHTKAKNLILVQCEALQYFVMGLEVGGKEVAPNLNKFARESLYFPNVWSQVAGGNSADAEFIANTGLFPSPVGAAYTLYDRNTYNSLARAMRKKNAVCFVMQGTASAFWNCNRMHGRLKFHAQYSQNTYPYDERIGLGLSDRVIFSRAVELMSQTDRPFYAFIVTLSSHHPFDFPEIPRDTLDLPKELEGTLVGNYLLAAHYFDGEFGRFIGTLRKRGILDNSLIAVYGDHPAIPIAYKENLEHLIGHKISNSTDWKKTRRVPLMIRTPEFAKAPYIDKRNVGQMDILPTVSSLMELGIKTCFGHNLMKKDNGLVIFRNGSYISGDVFVEPSAKRAVNLTTGTETDTACFLHDTEEAERELDYNDAVLEDDLLRDMSIY